MNEFIFLYRGGDRSGSAEQMQQQMYKWMAWMKDLGEKGVLKEAGQPLEPAGKVVTKGTTITDGPYAEAKDLVCGFTVILANDLAHAAEISAGCPIFEANGFVEVRPVMKMGA
jgi:hypothetical protein